MVLSNKPVPDENFLTIPDMISQMVPLNGIVSGRHRYERDWGKKWFEKKSKGEHKHKK